MGRIKCIVTRDKTAHNHFLNFTLDSIIVIDSHIYSLMAYAYCLSCPPKNMDNLLAYCYSSNSFATSFHNCRGEKIVKL